MKVYTRTGDSGTTSLVGGQRVKKHNERIEAYGSVDELMAHVAYLRDLIKESPLLDETTVSQEIDELSTIINRLMIAAGILACDKNDYDKVPPLKDEFIEALEQGIDRISAELTPIKRFTLPGGNTLVSYAHVARTACRRAERATVKAAEMYDIDAMPIMYINRLSDYLYVLGRLLVERTAVEEIYWEPSK